MPLSIEHERLSRELGRNDWLLTALSNHGLVLLFARGDLEVAMGLFKEMETLCHECGDRDKLATCLGWQARVFSAKGRWQQALALFQEQERLCVEIDNKQALQSSYGCQGDALSALGYTDGAIALYRKQEQICRQLPNADGLARSLINQAGLLPPTHSVEALRLAEAAFQVAAANGLTKLTQQIGPFLDAVRSRQLS